MVKREDGFTLVELMVTMVVFVLIIAASSGVLTGLLTQFKQQSKIAETNIEGIVGLGIFRQDIEHAGYGLPWNGIVSYSESTANPFSLNSAPTGVPMALITKNDADFSGANNIFDGSDYLVIRSVNVARNEASRKWTTIRIAPFTYSSCISPNPCNPRKWSPETENLSGTDRVIVVSPGTTDTNAKRLIVDASGSFFTTFANVISSPWPPTDLTEARIIYGINTSTDGTPLRPFNRADYFISTVDQSGNSIVPRRCAPNTGVFIKATMNHDAAGTYTYMPLLDCVADIQVVYALDNNEDGSFVNGSGTPPDSYSNDLSALTAKQIRDRVKQVRVYILAHEGQKDFNFTYSTSAVTVGEFGLGRSFNLTTITEWPNYRWKQYTIVMQTNNMR